MCGGDKGKTTNTSAPNPAAMQAYQDIMTRAYGASQTPYTPYTGQLVAPVNAQQQQGIGNINQYALAAQPGLQAAGVAMQNNTMPITASNIQAYENPYTQDVINKTMAQFADQNAQQLNMIKGNEISSGAFGNNRNAVAATTALKNANIAQDPIIANLRSQGYTTGLSTALQEQQAGQAGAYGIANIANSTQNAGLTGANAQVGAGTLQQSTQQAQDTALYQQYLNKMAYPFQTLQWLAGIDTGVGSGMGGTSTTQAPAPNVFNQIVGAGLSGAAAYGMVASDRRLKENIREIGRLHDGQRIYRFNYKGDQTTRVGLLAQNVEKFHPDAVHDIGGYKAVDYDAATRDAAQHRLLGGGVAPHFDDGGAAPSGIAGVPYSGGHGYMPTVGITHGRGLPPPPAVAQDNSGDKLQQQAMQIGKIANTLKTKPQGIDGGQVAYGADGSPIGIVGVGPFAGAAPSPPDAGPSMNIGALPSRPSPPIAPEGITIPRSDAGWGGMPIWSGGTDAVPHFDDGGSVPDFGVNAGVLDAPRGGYDGVAPPTGSFSMPRRGAAMNPADRDAVIRTIYGEAAGEPPEGQAAVAAVIRNRVHGGFGNSARDVVMAPNQFEPWNTDIGRSRMYGMPGDAYHRIGNVVDSVFSGETPDPTGGATHFYAPHAQAALGRQPPSWDDGSGMQIGNHLFFRPGEGGDAGVMHARFSPGASGARGARGAGAYAYSPTIDTTPEGVHPGGAFDKDSKLWPAMMAAGFGMMSSHSPYFGVAIGEGGLTGMATYAGERAQEQEAKMTSAKLGLESNKLAQEANFHREKLAEDTRHHTMEAMLKAREVQAKEMEPKSVLGRDGLPHTIKKNPDGSYSDIWTGETMLDPSGKPVGAASPDAKVVKTSFTDGDGFKLVQSKAIEAGEKYNYALPDEPYIEKGMEAPPAAAVGRHSSTDMRIAAENYLLNGPRALPPTSRGHTPEAQAMQAYRDAVQNYGAAIARSRGLDPREIAEIWQTAPRVGNWLIGQDGRAVVSLGTAMRHLDLLSQLEEAWQKEKSLPDKPIFNRLMATFNREWGGSAATNLETAARIVGPEIIKAIGVAGAGTEDDRRTAAGQFSAVSSADQVNGAILNTKKLMMGQLRGKLNQAAAVGVSEERFKKLVGEKEYEQLKALDSPAAKAGESSGYPTPTPAHIKILKENPSESTKSFFDKRYGPGAAKKALGE